jgi:hypothetical protein
MAKRKTRSKSRRSRRYRRSRRGTRYPRRLRPQRGGQGSAALLDGYFSYPVSGKVPSIKLADPDSIPTVMGKDDYEELKDDL